MGRADIAGEEQRDAEACFLLRELLQGICLFAADDAAHAADPASSQRAGKAFGLTLVDGVGSTPKGELPGLLEQCHVRQHVGDEAFAIAVWQEAVHARRLRAAHTRAPESSPVRAWHCATTFPPARWQIPAGNVPPTAHPRARNLRGNRAALPQTLT